MLTLLYDCEATINGRPLTYLSDDPKELKPLTPAHFIQDIKERETFDLDLIDSQHILKRVCYLHTLRSNLRKRFYKEYLGELVRSPKVASRRKMISPGEIVIVESKNPNRMNWPLAQVIELFPGKDGMELLEPGTDIAAQIPGPTAADVLKEGKKSRCGRPLIPVKRVNLFEEDFVKRYTFINVLLRGIIGGIAYYGANQIEVQRMLSLKSLNRAKSALNWSIIPSTSFLALCMLLGLMLYAIFDTCDPVKDNIHTGVRKYDQIVPYYIVSRFSSIPGLTGLCVAGIFSGSLSTLSSALNSLSAVTVFDLIKPIYKSRLSETKMVYIAKILSLCYGIICICFSFVLSKVDSLVAINNIVLSVVEGPVFAVFCIAVLSRKGSEKCILFGLLFGVLITAWIACGIQTSGYRSSTLLLDTSGCPKPVNATDFFQNSTAACNNLTQCLSTSLPSLKNEPFFLYKISFLWLPSLGFFTTLCAVFIAVIVTGWRHNAIPASSVCLSPVTRFWIRGVSSEIEKKELSKDLEEKIQLTAL
ncbi:putative sodium-dependent multivitamin transporter [Trichonephila inaurata madagascariensis]|uniref:Putative sodium-dependent multivitamin transporter n=1 Tax=Trichonephila inaurata madagascariensis TaxID=2747483 RepID=A0A8X6WXY8_9ARAC|nr:putative sodium-dependent multivitamin transporter [Trichonephila inaurata madagascariensis]